ncbi:MAG TPA: hypothetical protein VMA37_17035 [Acetobacteraceae bacterium]|nr:hypothetical protein [Acetobacteraceae bacterium]
MIVFAVIAGWFLVAVFGGVCFSLWLRFCGHRDPAGRVNSNLAAPGQTELRGASAAQPTPPVEAVHID